MNIILIIITFPIWLPVYLITFGVAAGLGLGDYGIAIEERQGIKFIKLKSIKE